jgi:hypothetical protein
MPDRGMMRASIGVAARCSGFWSDCVVKSCLLAPGATDVVRATLPTWCWLLRDCSMPSLR